MAAAKHRTAWERTQYGWKAKYRGHTITAERQRALGGWDNTYFHIVRDSDGLFLEDSFTTGSDAPRRLITALRHRVDECIETRGESECLADDWGDWKEPSPFDALFKFLKEMPGNDTIAGCAQ
jgi:hypothetical protein